VYIDYYFFCIYILHVSYVDFTYIYNNNKMCIYISYIHIICVCVYTYILYINLFAASACHQCTSRGSGASRPGWKNAQQEDRGSGHLPGDLDPMQDGCLLFFFFIIILLLLLLFCTGGTATKGFLTTTITEAGSSHKSLISGRCRNSCTKWPCKGLCLLDMGQKTLG